VAQVLGQTSKASRILVVKWAVETSQSDVVDYAVGGTVPSEKMYRLIENLLDLIGVVSSTCIKL
jgi:hypothetical protein